MNELQIGIQGQAEKVVTADQTAAALGSGILPVFGTPALVALMESAAVKALASYLPSDTTSVGVSLDIRHQAATPIGLSVRAQATLTQIEGRRLTFQVVAYDELEQIGEGTHSRVLVDTQRFTERVQAKHKE